MADGSQIIAQCEKCHQPTAPQAAVCPNCGALRPSSQEQSQIKRKNRIALWVLGGIVFVGCVVPIALALGLLVTCFGVVQNPH